MQFTHLNEEAVQHEDSAAEAGHADRPEQPAIGSQVCRSAASDPRSTLADRLFGHTLPENET